MPNPTRYHRWLGWHAPALRRAVIVGSVGLIVAFVLMWFVPWGMAVVAGWDAAALTFLVTIWPIIVRADSAHAAQLAKREDETRGSATVLLLGASVASLLGVGFALVLAGRQQRSTSGAAYRRRRAHRHACRGRWSIRSSPCATRTRPLDRGRGHRLRRRRRTGGTHVPRLCLRRIHDRHVLPGVRHHGARSPDPAHSALPRFLVVRVWRSDRWWFGQPHRWPGSLMSRARGLAGRPRAHLLQLPSASSPQPVEPGADKFPRDSHPMLGIVRSTDLSTPISFAFPAH